MTTEMALIDMFERLINQEAEAKAIKDDINESLETYAKNTECNPKSVKDLFRKYKAYKKNPEEFVLVDFEVDALLNKIIPEYQDKGGMA